MTVIELAISLLLGIPGVRAFADKLRPAVDFVAGLLQGEPARVIGYGAAVVIYVVAATVGRIPDMTFDQAIVTATTVITILVGVIEYIRSKVYSPATVEAILAELAEDAAE